MPGLTLTLTLCSVAPVVPELGLTVIQLAPLTTLAVQLMVSLLPSFLTAKVWAAGELPPKSAANVRLVGLTLRCGLT